MNADLTTDPLVAFYLGKSTDTNGRRIKDIWKWDNNELERTHDYIQWLFPLPNKSKFNPRAPILTVETIDVFRENDELKKRLITSLEIMLKFYGLKSHVFNDGRIEIFKATDFIARRSEWLTPKNHNFLRLTRILRSLQILGLSNWAQAFFKCLNEIYQMNSSEIGAETLAYWRAAAKSRSI